MFLRYMYKRLKLSPPRELVRSARESMGQLFARAPYYPCLAVFGIDGFIGEDSI